MNQGISVLSQGYSLRSSDMTVMGVVKEGLSKEVTSGPIWRRRALMTCQAELG